MVSEIIKTSGNLTITLYGPNNEIKHQVTVPNMIVTTGKNFIAASMLKTTSNSPVAMTHMALGSGTTAPVMANTTLENEFVGGGNSRSSVTASVADSVVTYSATFGPGNCVGSVTEAGIFNNSTGGTMLCRTKFPVVTKEAADTITIVWNITLG